MNTPKQSIEELQQAIDQASAEMEAARQKLFTATRTLNIAQRSRHPDIQEARRVAGLLRNTYNWQDGEDPSVEPICELLAREERVRVATGVWMGGELALTVHGYGDDNGEGLATCIAQAGQVILDLAAEVVRLREQAKADETAFHPGSGLPFLPSAVLRLNGFQPTGRHCGDCAYRRAQEDGTSRCAVEVRAPVEKGMWACTAHVRQQQTKKGSET